MRGDPRLYRRAGSPYWWVRFFLDGKELRESTGETDENKALRILKAKRDQLGAVRRGREDYIGPAQKKLSVADLLDDLEADARLRGRRSWAQFASHLKVARETWGHWRSLDVNEGAIDAHIEESLEKGVRPATINRRLQMLRQALRLGVERKRLSSMPKVRRLSELGNERKGFFEEAEFKAVVEHLPDYLKDFARFGRLSGWRKSEITSLTWADVDRAGRTLHLRPEHSKNSEGRTLPLAGELWEIVERRGQAREVNTASGETQLALHVFHCRGRQVGDFRKSWAEATKKAGVEGKLFHDLRRTRVRDFERAGVPRSVAMAITGHKTEAVYRRYDIVDEADLTQALAKAEEYLRNAPSQPAVVSIAKAKAR